MLPIAMPISKRYLDTQKLAVPVDREGIAGRLSAEYPEVVFAFVHGSARGGIIAPHSDLDLAIYTSEALSADRYLGLAGEISALHQGVRCDLGLLNRADPIYAFEALKGDRVLCRCDDVFAQFFSETCRRYEFAMASFERQRAHRLSRRNMKSA